MDRNGANLPKALKAQESGGVETVPFSDFVFQLHQIFH